MFRSSYPISRRSRTGFARRRGVSSALTSAAGWVESSTWNDVTPARRRITSGARLEPPIPSRTTFSRPSSATPRANSRSAPICGRVRSATSSQPSHELSSRPVQRDASRAQSRSTAAGPSNSIPYAVTAAALALDAGEKLLERRDELVDAFALEQLGHIVVVDAGRREPIECRSGSVDVVRNADGRLTVILESADSRLRHRVDRVGADQVLDVHDVAIGRILGRCRRPQAALRARALRREVVPPLAREHIEIVLVREPPRWRSPACP